MGCALNRIRDFGEGKLLRGWRWAVPNSSQVANITEIYYNPLILVTKLSILLQYIRIFTPSHDGKTYWIIHVIIWLNVLFYLSSTLVEILGCLPRDKIWNSAVSGYCVNLPAVLTSGAVINIVSDFSILILPIGKVWQLQMTLKRKLKVSAVFAAGLLWVMLILMIGRSLLIEYSACVSSVFRLVNNVKFSHTRDVTYRIMPVSLWPYVTSCKSRGRNLCSRISSVGTLK